MRSLAREAPLEKQTAALSSILAWRIPRAEDLVGYSHLFIQKKTAGVLFSASTLGYPCAFNMFSPNDRDDLFLSPESSSSDFELAGPTFLRSWPLLTGGPSFDPDVCHNFSLFLPFIVLIFLIPLHFADSRFILTPYRER